MKKILNINFIILGLITSSIFLTSCGSSKKIYVEDENTDEPKGLQIEDNKKEEKKTRINKILVYLGDDSVIKWKLINLHNQNASELYENLPLMRFDEPWKQILGTTGCNKFTAYYERNNNALVISRITATEMGCDNKNESSFLEALKQVDEINETSNNLSLLANGNVILVFEKF